MTSAPARIASTVRAAAASKSQRSSIAISTTSRPSARNCSRKLSSCSSPLSCRSFAPSSATRGRSRSPRATSRASVVRCRQLDVVVEVGWRKEDPAIKLCITNGTLLSSDIRGSVARSRTGPMTQSAPREHDRRRRSPTAQRTIPTRTCVVRLHHHGGAMRSIEACL